MPENAHPTALAERLTGKRVAATTGRARGAVTARA